MKALFLTGLVLLGVVYSTVVCAVIWGVAS